MFRKLKANEVDVRTQSISYKDKAKTQPKGSVLLLYKDARCDMNILDDTVGAMGWKREHSRDNANCTVSLWDEDKSMWVGKEDTGTESNQDAQKGLASDSFKRACFNWGIGRELYTAPFVWINVDAVKDLKYAKYKCDEIGYDDNGVINRLVISSDNKVVFSFGSKTKVEKPKAEQHNQINVKDIQTKITNLFEQLVSEHGTREKLYEAIKMDSEQFTKVYKEEPAKLWEYLIQYAK